jgi:hypothetical protein
MNARRFAWIALLVLGLVSPSASAQAPPVFYACAKEDGKLKKLSVDVAPTCPAGQTLVSWGQAASDPTTLPSGATLRGIWGPAVTGATASGQIVHISFPLQLAANPTFDMAHWVLWNQPTEDCPGFVDGSFQAAPGHLCIYQANSDAQSGVESKTAQWSHLGVKLILAGPQGGAVPVAEGMWAVTAP